MFLKLLVNTTVGNVQKPSKNKWWNGDAACNVFEGKLRLNLVNKHIIRTASTVVVPIQAPIA